MAIFTIPQFNLGGDLWVNPHTPAADPPDVVGIPCQVYVASKGFLDITPSFPNLWVPPVYIRIPLGVVTPARGDIIQVNYLPADYYLVRWVQHIHMGFPNEYIVVLVEQCDGTGATPR